MIGNNLSVKWQLIEREALAQALRTMDTDVVVTFGAGNIDAVCEDIYEVLKTKM
jgi:UDP-N-acetylmuramate--alanine ligase